MKQYHNWQVSFYCFYIFLISLSCNSQKNIVIYNDSNNKINITENQTFGIELLTHPGTGYKWEVKDDINTVLLKNIKKEYRELGDEQLDFPGVDYFEFKAIKKGNTTIEIWYIRPWKKDNKNNPNIRIETFYIEIK